MIVPRFFILPGITLVATAGYMMFGPGSGPISQGSVIPTATEEHSRLIAPTAIPTRLQNPLPPSLSGRLTYRTGTNEVTVQFPDVREVSRAKAVGEYALQSADGLWTVDRKCAGAPSGNACTLTLTSRDGHTRDLQLDLDMQWSRSVQWSPVGHRLAVLTTLPASSELRIVNDPYSGEPAIVETARMTISAFTWTADGTAFIAARGNGVDSALVQIDATNGDERILASLRQLPNFLYPSPDRSMLAFTGDNIDGWHLFLYDSRRPDEIRDLGPMGSDGPDGKPIPQGAPDVKTPMYIAWSPDGHALAFGGGMEPPYVMTTLDLASGEARKTEFSDGYPGEIKWSPDGILLAVSTYNTLRTHHESYVVYPRTGIARDVLSGCVIVWSPDSRFLAIHGEREPGVAIADVATLEHAQLTHTIGDTPLEWTP